MNRFSILILSVLAIMAGAASCNPDIIVDGDTEEVKELKSMVLNEDGSIAFDRTLKNGPYQIGVETTEDAANLARLYVGCDFTGEDYTRTLKEDKGTVHAAPGKASIFYSVQFDVKGITPFTLNIKNASEMGDDMESGHSGTYHKCSVCGFTWRSTSTVCPMTSTHGK